MMKDLIIPKTKETKIIFFSGKGGVGKSTMSCATAVWIAKQGYKTLLVTTDPAPNLSDIFGQPIGHKITNIRDVKNLYAIEINPDIASEEYRERIISPMRELLDEKSLKTIKEQLNSPCVEEVAAFDKFMDFMDGAEYDVVIFDTAPTGHTIRLLELPGGWSATLKEGASTCIGPGASLQSAKAKYEKAISYLKDDKKNSFIFVLRPEKLSIFETKRSSEELETMGVKTSSLIINDILPDEACSDKFFRKKKEEEQKAIDIINSEFRNVQKAFYPLKDTEISGIKRLESIGDYLYDGKKESLMAGLSKEKNITKFRWPDNKKEIFSLLTPSNGTRYVFFTGKGGVGKSTIACTTALYLSDKGFKTLIITTDPASHLQCIFKKEIKPEPTKLATNLFAARIDQKKALKEYKKRIMVAIKDKDAGTKKSIEEDLNSPCAEEMSAFEKFMSYFELDGYDIIVFDTAPTGHTLRLLELPSDWKGFIDLGGLTKETSKETKNKYDVVIETMRNKKKSTFVFVMYPEYTPIVEAWRASEDLKKQVGVETGLLAVNYVLPDSCGNNHFFNNRRRQQEKYLFMITQKFKAPLFSVPLLDYEPNGLDKLKLFGQTIFDG